MGSADLPEPAATCQQNSYACRSSAPYSSSVTLIYARRVSVKLTHLVVILQRPADAVIVCVKQLGGYRLKAHYSVT
jgi:hypothetical protein